MAGPSISNTFNFNGTSYYYRFSVSSAGMDANINYLAYSYQPYATFWAYSAATTFGKNVSSVIINLTPKTYNVGNNQNINVFAACATLDTSNNNNNMIKTNTTSKFGATTGEVVLPRNGSVNLDITNVVAFAAANYNQPWGLYLIGSNNNVITNYASNVQINDPTFVTLSINDGLMKVHNGSAWADGTPYIYNGSTWVKAKGVYLHNGSSWIQV